MLRKFTKKTLALLLAVCLVLMLTPLTASATANTNVSTAAALQYALQAAQPGDTVTVTAVFSIMGTGNDIIIPNGVTLIIDIAGMVADITVINFATLTVESGGIITINRGTLTISGVLGDFGTFTVLSGGTVNINGRLTSLNTGEINNYGTINNNNEINLLNNNFFNSGTINNSPNGNFIGAGTMNNNGNINDNVSLYTVTMNDTNLGNFAAGNTVTIGAGTPPSGQQFVDWTTIGVTLSSPSSANTTFTMPANAVMVTANWVAITPIITISTQPTSPSPFTYGNITGGLSVTATVTQGATLSYQWYSNTTSSNSGGTAITGATSASFTIPTNLTAGTYYYFVEVRATGAASVRSNVATVNVNATVPGVPRDVAANAGDGYAVLHWHYPASDGGAAITRYDVSSDGITWIPASSLASHRFDGLTNGTAYTLHVRAVNSAGFGASASATATPQEGLVLSGDNNLSALTISAGTLSPVFSASVTSYTATVANSVTNIIVNSTTAHSAADIYPNSAFVRNLNVGANIINIIVTAENGATKTYTITVTREASGGSNNNNNNNNGSSGGNGDGGWTPSPASPSYSFANRTFVQGSGEPLVKTIQHNFSQFNNVRVGTTTLTRNTHFTAASGSTVITLLPAYLDTLPTGRHNVTVNFTGNVRLNTHFYVEATSEFTNPFADVRESDWFYDAVMYVFGKGLMVGVADDRFAPQSTLTRGMIVTILHRMAGEPDVSGLVNPFTDVPDDEWYTGAIKWGYENEIVSGYGGGRFGPNDPVTKEQLAVLIRRTQLNSDKIPPDILMGFEWADWDSISDWAKSAVNVLTIQGILADLPRADGLLNPRTPATRAEVASMLYRYLTAVE